MPGRLPQEYLIGVAGLILVLTSIYLVMPPRGRIRPRHALIERRERYVDQRKAPASAVHLQMAGSVYWSPLTSGLLGQE